MTQSATNRHRITGMPGSSHMRTVRKYRRNRAPWCVSVLAEWFLTSGERGNPDWDLPAWSEGNQAEALIHGAAYFDRLVTEVEQLGPGDHLFFADWRGDADERLRENGPTVA